MQKDLSLNLAFRTSEAVVQSSSYRERCFKNFSKFTGKTFARIFFKMLLAWGCDFIKKRLWHSYFPVNFATFLRTCFFNKTPLDECFCRGKFPIIKMVLSIRVDWPNAQKNTLRQILSLSCPIYSHSVSFSRFISNIHFMQLSRKQLNDCFISPR